jgi:polyisoprenoid-binding protein YceI
VRDAAGAGKFEVEGDLTIRDLTRPVVVSVTLQQGSAGLVFDGSAVVKMKDYNMKPPSAAMGLIGTMDEMLLTFHLLARPER